MTTANLTIISKDMKVANVWGWNDGYQIDAFINTILKDSKVKNFGTPEELKQILLNADKEYGFDKAEQDECNTDWTWVITIFDKKTATIVGCGEGRKKISCIKL